MNITMTTSTKTKSGKMGALRILLGITAMAGALMAAPTVAEARVGDTKSIPSYNGTGSVSYSRYWGGTVSFDNSGSTCVYVQYQYVAVAGLDSGWSRLTADDCGGAAGRESFYKPTSRGFNGMAFRLCKVVDNWSDSCGSKVTIYN